MPGARLERTGGSVTSVRFNIPGEPAPKGSKNLGRNGQLYEQSKSLPDFQRRARIALAGAAELVPPYRLHVAFVCQRPKASKFNWPVRGDADKFVRALGDELQRAGVITDDKHIISIQADKIYGSEAKTRGYVETIKGY